MSDDASRSGSETPPELASTPDPTETPPAPRPRTGGGRGRRFEKGNQAAVGNKGGRPKRDAFLDQFFEEVVRGKTADGKEFSIERRRALLERLYTSAMDTRRKDHGRLLEVVCAYYFGKPRERLEMSGPGGKPIATQDSSPGRRPTTGELRKRLDELMAKRAAHLTAQAAAKDQVANGETTNGENKT